MIATKFIDYKKLDNTDFTKIFKNLYLVIDQNDNSIIGLYNKLPVEYNNGYKIIHPIYLYHSNWKNLEDLYLNIAYDYNGNSSFILNKYKTTNSILIPKSKILLD